VATSTWCHCQTAPHAPLLWRSFARLLATNITFSICRLEGGEINLVATQLQLDREHPNRLVFSSEAGLDPAVDVVLTGSRLRAHINGRASAWQDHIVLTSGPRSNTTAAAGTD